MKRVSIVLFPSPTTFSCPLTKKSLPADLHIFLILKSNETFYYPYLLQPTSSNRQESYIYHLQDYGFPQVACIFSKHACTSVIWAHWYEVAWVVCWKKSHSFSNEYFTYYYLCLFSTDVFDIVHLRISLTTKLFCSSNTWHCYILKYMLRKIWEVFNEEN